MHAACSNMDDLTLVSESTDCFLLKLTSVTNFVHVSTLFSLINQLSSVPALSFPAVFLKELFYHILGFILLACSAKIKALSNAFLAVPVLV